MTLPSELEIAITRIFDAPKQLVFEAWTTPALVRRWWGWETSELVLCDIDLRPGGEWRSVTRDAEGTELGWDGERVLAVTALYACREHRDGHLASGMARGMQHSLDRFEDLVVALGGGAR